MDEALRSCERALAMGGRSPVELLRLRVRAGRIDRRRVEAAARIGSQAACEALGRQARREARLPALLVSAREAAGEAGRAWAVSAVAEWLVARPGEVLTPAEVLVAVAAVRARCEEPDHPKHLGRVAALERASTERLRSAREALDELLLGGLDLDGGDPVGGEGPAETTPEGDLCEGVADDWLLDDMVFDEDPARTRASSEAIRVAEQACRDIELEQLVLHAALGPEGPAAKALELALRTRVRGDQPRCSLDAEVDDGDDGDDGDDDDDALDERTWEADQRERAVVEHVRASLEAWLLGEPDERRERGGDVWRRK